MSCGSGCCCARSCSTKTKSKSAQGKSSSKGTRAPLSKKDDNASSQSTRKSGSNIKMKTDPNTLDLNEMMREYDKTFFSGRVVKGNTTVCWSRRLTASAGNCSNEIPPKIQLSELLLRHRPLKDTIETLLHEMIHAYLALVGDEDEDAEHSEEFIRQMKRINKMTGLKITVDHDFDREVEMYQHHWRCTRCRDVIKRGLNRPPGPSEKWFVDHKDICGGTYEKIKDPLGKTKSKK